MSSNCVINPPDDRDAEESSHELGVDPAQVESASDPNLEYLETTDQSSCGKTYWCKLDKATGKWHYMVWYCRKHTCERCAESKGKRHAYIVLGHLDGKPYHHVVLTLARDETPLRKRVRQLYDSFRTLNKRPRWKRYVHGGVWFFDCAFKNRQWGPHLHLIVEAKELPLDWLRKAWLEITEDSWEVYAELIDNFDEKLTKTFYAAKVPYRSFAKDAAAMKVYQSVMKGKRKSQPIGSWYRVLRLNPRRKPKAENV